MFTGSIRPNTQPVPEGQTLFDRTLERGNYSRVCGMAASFIAKTEPDNHSDGGLEDG
jgi:hypothetical protein